MATQFNIRYRVGKPKVSVGQWVRVRLPMGHKKTDPIHSESYHIVSFVAPFTVMLDNGKNGIALKYVREIIETMMT